MIQHVSFARFGYFRTVANTGNTREYSEIDLENHAKKKGEGAQSERARVQQGYSKVATLKRIALDIGITYEMRTQNKYQEVVSRLTNLGSLAARRIELDLSHRITFGGSTSYVDMDGDTVDLTVGDGLALFHAAHTVRGSALTYRNILSGNPAFSKTALEGMEKLIVEETINQFGEKMAMPFDIIFSTDDPNTEFDPDSGKKGIDITGRSGQSVFSAAAGDVVYSGSGLLGDGNLVIIKHDEIYLSAYGHNSQLLVKEGDKVATGQEIAKMGVSPKEGAMLHFEIRKEGKPVDPRSYLPKKN